MLNKFTQTLLFALSLMVLAACGSVAPEEVKPDVTPSVAFSPCDTQPCSWNFLGTNPLKTGTGMSSPKLAIDENGFSVLASRQYGGIGVKRFSGDWTSFGGIVTNTTSSSYFSLRLDSFGYPWIAHQSSLGPVRVVRWDGMFWVEVGGIVCPYSVDVRGFALDTNNQPIVACNEADGESETSRVRVYRYIGNAWTPLPTIEHATLPEIAVDANNNILMAHKMMSGGLLVVTRWTGNRWRTLGTTSSKSMAGYDFKLDSQGRPVVVDQERVNGQMRLVVKRWNGKAFVMVGPAIRDPFHATSYPMLSVRGNLIAVGFVESGWIRVVEYNPTNNSWVQRGNTVNVSSTDPYITPQLAYPPSGEPVVAWDDYNPYTSSWSLLVKHWSPTPLAPPAP